MQKTTLSLRSALLIMTTLVLSTFTVLGCSNSGVDVTRIASNAVYNPFENPAVFFSTMDTLHIEVAYEAGAEPNTGNTAFNMPYWSFLEQNIASLFKTRELEPLMIVPKSLQEMTAIPDQNKTTWTLDEIYTLSTQYRKGASTKTTGNFWIVYLNGNIQENGQPNPSILGIKITGINILVIFQDVIKATSPNPNGYVAKYMEQLTMIHEMGHGLGLVDGGLPMQTEHHDAEHKGHCSNPNCIMFWANEGASTLQNFINNYLLQGTVVFFGSECLKDTQQYGL